jgi:hypothetical protein
MLSPWQSVPGQVREGKACSGLDPGAGGSPLPSFGRKFFMLAHASIKVPSLIEPMNAVSH